MGEVKIPLHITEKLQQRKEIDALRELSCKAYSIDFYSNDYIGFSRSELLKEQTEKRVKEITQNGATGSRLISGNFQLLEETENHIANFHNSESALLFTSGYTANIGFFSSIAKRGDVILFDEFIHASIRDGMALGQAKTYKFSHNDCEDLERKLQKYQQSNTTIFVVTESVFSMDGDTPNFHKMVELIEAYQSYLIVDEAHAVGVLGKKGVGLISDLGYENQVFARIITYGKALGSHGACVLVPNVVRQYLVNFARSFIYTTGLSPHSVAQIREAYQLLESTQEMEKLYCNIIYFQELCHQKQWNLPFVSTNSPIQSVVVGGNIATKKMAELLQNRGFGVKPILSPTVPKGKERIRICLHSFNTKEEIKKLVEILHKNS